MHFIIEGLGEGLREEFYTGIDSRFIGDSDFVKDIKEKTKDADELDWLEREIRRSAHEKISLLEILKIVSKTTNVSPESILSDRREKQISHARSLFAFLSVRYAGYRGMQIARYLKRELGTISNVIKRIEERNEDDQNLFQILDEIMKFVIA